MLTQQQAIELWHKNDLIALGREADQIRKRLHPEAVVSYTLQADESATEYVFSSADTVEQRLEVLADLRKRQEQNGEILLFRPLVDASATGMEYMKTVALSRLCLDNVPHIQGSWKLFGMKVAQLSLRFGANDLGLAEGADEEELRRLIRDAGFVPKQRDALFRNYAIN